MPEESNRSELKDGLKRLPFGRELMRGLSIHGPRKISLLATISILATVLTLAAAVNLASRPGLDSSAASVGLTSKDKLRLVSV